MRVLKENEESHLSSTSCEHSHLHYSFRHLKQQSSRFTIVERDEAIRDPIQRPKRGCGVGNDHNKPAYLIPTRPIYICRSRTQANAPPRVRIGLERPSFGIGISEREHAPLRLSFLNPRGRRVGVLG
jgi:hypothetical protein